MSEIKILHLSDLHYDSSKPKDTQIILDALWKDLDNFPGIDFILFSGDLVKAGDKKKDFKKASQAFIEPLLMKTNLNEDKFFISPGNHDVQKMAIDEIIEAGLKALARDRIKLNSILDNEIEIGFKHIERLKNFNKFITSLKTTYTKTSNKLFTTYILEKEQIKIGIACLNTAWRSTGAPNDEDRGRLLIGERQIDMALDDIKNCNIKIALFHHPIECLTQYDYCDSEKRLSKEFDFLFCGHLHSPNIRSIQTFENKALLVQGGSLDNGRSYYNGYSVLCFDHQNRNGTIYFRSYFDDRGFDKAINHCQDGKMPIVMSKPSIESENVLTNIMKNQTWAKKLSKQLDEKISNLPNMYLECSSKSIFSTLSKLENLFELIGILNEEEREVLVAAQYLHILNILGEDLIKSKKILCESMNTSNDLSTAAVITADAICTESQLESDMKIGNIRCDLLAALLRISKIISLNRDAIADKNCPPPDQDRLDHWRAFLTNDVILKRSGLVTLHLLISKQYHNQNDLFIRFAALSFEALWQKLRKIFTQNGIALCRTPSRITTSPDIDKLPGPILKQLEKAKKDAEESIPKLLHLGDSSPAEFNLSQIVPLAYSAIVNPLSFKVDQDHEYALMLMQMDTHGNYIGSKIKYESNGGQEILLSPDDLPTASAYRWWIMRNEGDFELTVTTGCIKTLSAEERNRWEMVKESNAQTRYVVMESLELWNDIMIEIGQKIISDYASFEEMMLVHHGLIIAFEWVEKNSSFTGQIDLYRNAAEWLRSLFIENKEK